MPRLLNSKIFWLVVGMNDLVRGGCSEEATELGILRVADEIYFTNPNSVIVIQGILPRTNHKDGSLSIKNPALPHLFVHHDKNSKMYWTVREAKKKAGFWPSIQNVNAQLEQFCAQHKHLVYFDASSLFLESVGGKNFRSKEKRINKALIREGKLLTLDGYTILGQAIVKELERIIFDDNEANDIEIGHDALRSY